MADTKIADIIVPEVFNPYVIERTAELTELLTGGIISQDPSMNILASRGGSVINMPFYTDLTGDDEVLSDSGALTVNNIDTAQDKAVLLQRGKAWGVNDLAKALSGDDPMAAVGNLVSQYWARKNQATLFAVTEGVFASDAAGAAEMVIDVAVESVAAQTVDTKMSQSNILDAVQTMGDAGQNVVAIAMHSAMATELKKAKVIEYEQRTGDTVAIPRIDDLRVIIDDSCPRVAGTTDGFKYTSYLYGEGAIAFGQGGAPVPTETDRDSLAGVDILVNRQHYILHPRGVAFQSAAVAGASPTNAELATAANWTRVYERKNVRMAKLVTN